MKLNKIILGTSLTLGLVAFVQTEDVQAAEWTARTAEEVVADFKAEDSSNKTYTIQWGDTLGVIAKAADVQVATLVEINNIKNADLIFPGNKLSFKTDAAGEIEEVTIEDTATETVETYSVEETTEAAPVVEEVAPVEEVVVEEVVEAAPVVEVEPEPVVEAAAPVATSGMSAQEAFNTIAAQKGLSAYEINGWSSIISRESGWNLYATNPTSGAYGLAQALPASKMSTHGSDWASNPYTQLSWMYDYMIGRYGSIAGAVSFWNANSWY